MKRKKPKNDYNAFRIVLLDWYDRHRRELPWRAKAGETPNPYYVWLSEIMLQQTTVGTVIPYFQKFVDKWPDVNTLARANRDDILKEWAGLGYYARARNLHKCAQVIVDEFDGRFPSDLKSLKSLPGVGEYTAAAIRSIAFDLPANVVDGNVERVMARYFRIVEPMPSSKRLLKHKAAELSEGRQDRPGDYAQALMDLGAMVCIPKAPRCGLCPLNASCSAFESGVASELPKVEKKKNKPKKYGYIYWITDGKGNVLLEKRPEKGILGGMIGFPTSVWTEDEAVLVHPDFLHEIGENLRPFPEKSEIYHSFTHFDLKLSGFSLFIPGGSANYIEEEKTFCFVPEHDLDEIGFPSLFKKFFFLIRNTSNYD